MKKISAILIMATLLFFTSCISSKVISFYVIDDVDLNFQTFSFYRREVSKLNTEYIEVDKKIQHSIETELINKGCKKANPSDVYISFKITTETNISNQINRPSNYYQGYSPYYNISTSQYKEGVMVFEFWSDNDKLLWQGSKTFKVRKSQELKELLVQYAMEITSSFKSRL